MAVKLETHARQLHVPWCVGAVLPAGRVRSWSNARKLFRGLFGRLEEGGLIRVTIQVC